MPEKSTRSLKQTLPAQSSQCQQYYLTLLRSLPLQCNKASDPVATLGITSCYAGEGVSTVAVQLALAAASTGMRVLLVDLNWRRPTLHKTFGVACSPGMTEALAQDEETEIPVQASHISNLCLLTAGTVHRDFHSVTSLEKMQGLIHSLRTDYDLIIFDLPESAKAGADLLIGRLLDGIVLVVESERVRWEVAARVQELLIRSGARVLGAVLNKRRQPIPSWLYRTL